MAKPRTDQQEERLINELRSSIVYNFGRKCEDHEAECCVCSVYKALNEIERLYGQEETK